MLQIQGNILEEVSEYGGVKAVLPVMVHLEFVELRIDLKIDDKK